MTETNQCNECPRKPDCDLMNAVLAVYDKYIEEST